MLRSHRRRNSTRVVWLFVPVRRGGSARPSRSRSILCGAGCVGAVYARQARERSSGEIPTRLLPAGPGRAKPKGASSDWPAKHGLDRQGLSEGAKPRNRESLARIRLPSGTLGRRLKRYVGSTGGKPRLPFARRKLRRVNPMSAAGVKQNRRGVEGSKASRG